jgi:hypothetical protein
MKANIGTWIEQKNTETIALVVDELKNGGLKVLAHDWRGRIVQKTTTGWYPEPTPIEIQDVPEKVKVKVMKYIDQKRLRKEEGNYDKCR